MASSTNPPQQQPPQDLSVPHERTADEVEQPVDVARDTDEDDDGIPRGYNLSRRNTESIIEDDDRRELNRIASIFSQRRASVAVDQPQALDSIDEEALYNPENEGFDIEKWIRRFFQESLDEGFSSKRTGVCFRNLDIYGSGSAIQLQETVGTFATAPARIGELFSFKKNDHKQILHSFDGVIKPGELVVVLGRPGSGCSTLLKSLCGELHGLMLGEETKIHYNGIPQKQMMKEFRGETIYNQEVGFHPSTTAIATINQQ